jgi:hypothetical protein
LALPVLVELAQQELLAVVAERQVLGLIALAAVAVAVPGLPMAARMVGLAEMVVEATLMSREAMVSKGLGWRQV